MKKINFQNSESKINLLIISILIVAVIINTLSVFEIYKFENSKHQKIFSSLTYSLIAIYLSRIFWYKNVFQWNRYGFTLRINNIWGINKKFKNIEKFEFDGNNIFIKEFDGNQEKINLINIDEKSKLKLVKILNSKIK